MDERFADATHTPIVKIRWLADHASAKDPVEAVAYAIEKPWQHKGGLFIGDHRDVARIAVEALRAAGWKMVPPDHTVQVVATPTPATPVRD